MAILEKDCFQVPKLPHKGDVEEEESFCSHCSEGGVWPAPNHGVSNVWFPPAGNWDLLLHCHLSQSLPKTTLPTLALSSSIRDSQALQPDKNDPFRQSLNKAHNMGT